MTLDVPVVLHAITSLEDGGAEAVLYRLCTSDARSSHTVVSLMGAGKYGPLLEAAGTRVECLDMPRGRVTIRGIAKLWTLIRRVRPQVVQTWMYHADLMGGLLGKLAGVPAVCWAIHHTTLVPGQSRFRTRAVAWLNARLSHVVPHAIVCCGERARQVHAEKGYDAHKLVVIPNGCDFAQFHPDEDARLRLRQQWKIDAGVALIGMVARFNEQKDHPNLLRAVGKLLRARCDFRLALVGTHIDGENTILQEWIAREGLADHVMLLGRRDDIPQVMSALDLHVLPSLGEAFPNVLAEAMACGTPCVATDVGDSTYIVGDTGWIVPPCDSDALACALHQALDELRNKATWSRRRRAARERVVARYDVHKMVDAYRSVWNGDVLRASSPEEAVMW